ncbi:MAG: hypothetical protein ABSC91_04745 [Candidatus Bathyarchaeia archaeon]
MKPVRIASRIKKTFGSIRKRWNGISQAKIDFYSLKYMAVERLFWIFLAAYGMFTLYVAFWFGTYYVRAIVQKSLQSLISSLSWFALLFGSLMVFGVIWIPLRRAILNTFTYSSRADLVQTPGILRLNRISRNARTARLAFFFFWYTAMIGSYAVSQGTSTRPVVMTDLLVRVFPYLSSAFIMTLLTSSMVVYLFEMELKSPSTVFWSLAYLEMEENSERLRATIGLVSKEIVENLHFIFLYWCWPFTKRINLWPQFQVIFLALISGNEKEKKAAKDLLLEIMKASRDAMKEPRSIPASYRRVYDLVDRFQKRMKSLSSLRDGAMFEGRPTIRGLHLRERADENESLIMIVLTAISVVIPLVILLR